jgi:hypothetical protein
MLKAGARAGVAVRTSANIIDRILGLFPRRKVDIRMDEQNLPAAGSPSPSASTGPIEPLHPPQSQALTTTTGQTANAPAGGASMVDPSVLAMRERSLIDGILTNESLTADLDDEAAQEMIDWSIAMAREAVQQTAGLEERQAEKAVSERMYAQRKLMRSVKRLILEKDRLDEKTRGELIEQVRSQTRVFYGGATRAEAGADELMTIVREPAGRPGQAVSRIRRALDPHTDRTDQRPERRNARDE